MDSGSGGNRLFPLKVEGATFHAGLRASALLASNLHGPQDSFIGMLEFAFCS